MWRRIFSRRTPVRRKRIKLLRLAFDASLSSFAGRQRLYEQFYTGDPMRTQALLFNMYDTDTHIERIHTMLDELEKTGIDRMPGLR